MPRTFNNPILPGFYPDPTICRVEDDYYLVTSTFEFFPGLPIFHSKDLVNWQQIGHVLTRPEQLNLDGVHFSGGLFAPTLRHHKGTFYIINTLVDGNGPGESGNFIVTAPDILGPWSNPVWLPTAQGIDPSLFFDDDGRVWYTGNRFVKESRYSGHCEIWLQELDAKTLQLFGPEYSLWEGALKDAIWPEGPHLYKIKGQYYLLIAEAGTSHDHAVCIAKSESVTGPYVGYPRNPVLTHRHLGWTYPIMGIGHPDLVETQNGEWWIVVLGMRLYGGDHFNLGRETFLVPITWEHDWPVANIGVGVVEMQGIAPNLPEHTFPHIPARDDFDTDTLAFHWNFLRTPRTNFWSLQDSKLRLKLQPQTIMEAACPSFVGRRQQHINFTCTASLEFVPQSENECAGLVLLQNNNFHFRLVVTKENANGNTVAQLIKRENGTDTVLGTQPIACTFTTFKVIAIGQDYSFYIAAIDNETAWAPLAENVDGRILSTTTADGFIGAYIGMYASSNGHESNNHADWDWFEYEELK
jgi:xylan 1,4-beta-xylosidase